MPKSNLKVAPAIKPRSSIPVPVSPCVLYKCHETTGATVSDALGNGPDLTLVDAATGTPRSNVGYITPNGTSHYLNVATSTYLHDLFRHDTAWEQIIIAMDYVFDADMTGNEELFYFGTEATSGGYGIYLTTLERPVLDLRRVGSGSATTYGIVGAELTAFGSVRNTLLFELVKTGASTFDVNVYRNGNALATYIGCDWAGAPWGADQGLMGFSIGAHNLYPTTDRRGNAGGSNCQYGRFFAMRRAVRDSAFAAELAMELSRFQGEIPLCIDGM